MSSNPAHFEFDLPRLSAQLPPAWRLEYFDELNSTNDWALEQFRSAPPAQPVLILARTQLQGRGRGDHRWQAPQGNLTCSLAFPLNQTRTASDSQPLSWSARLSFAAALATLQTANHFLPRESCGIKWPNDLLIENRKVAGILIENTAPSAGQGSAGNSLRTSVIGIGLNVNAAPQLKLEGEGTLRALPPTSLAAMVGASCDLTAVALQLADHLNFWLTQLSAVASNHAAPAQANADTQLLERLQQHLVWRGEAVTVRTGEREIHGILSGIDAAGQLELLGPTGKLVFAAGELRRDERPEGIG